MWYVYGQTPQFARADADDMSEHSKTLCFVGQNAHVHDHGFHLATDSLATCALNVTTTTSSSQLNVKFNGVGIYIPNTLLDLLN